MKPSQLEITSSKISRRGALLCGLLALTGCSEPLVNSQSPEHDFDLLESNVKLVRDYARPHGTNTLKVEGLTLVTQLDGTGGDPSPSVIRAAMLSEMQTRQVDRPNQILASPKTALVLATGYLRPGIQKGDHFDVLLQVEPKSKTKSLRGGFMMETRMTEMALIGQHLRQGRLLALARGSVVVDPTAEGDDAKGLRRGRVLGGGISTRSRDLGLMLRGEHKSIRKSSDIGSAINGRFHVYVQGVQKGVATPKSDRYVELKVHPRYKQNLARYMAVVRAIAVRETPAERSIRLRLLERLLLDPINSAQAAISLEAVGQDGVKILRQGLASPNAEVRFYSAEALAYLDHKEAAEPLALAARDEPAFRAYALTALGSMQDVAAYDALRKLFDASSAETRYGAFRALWAMEPDDPLVRGQGLGGEFSYHSVKSNATPMVHITRSFRPEIVLFGSNQRLITPVSLDAGRYIVINAHSRNEVQVTRLSLDSLAQHSGRSSVIGCGDGLDDNKQRKIVSSRLDDVIRAIVEVGGDYCDVVQALQEAKAKGALSGRLEVDALPRYGLTYHRQSSGDGQVDDSGDFSVGSPTSELFFRPDEKEKSLASKRSKRQSDGETEGEGAESSEISDELKEKPGPLRAFFDRITY